MKDDEIQQKLVELETAILKEARPADNAQIKTVDSDSSLSKAPSKQDNIHTKHMSESTKSDIHYFFEIRVRTLYSGSTPELSAIQR